MVRFSWLASVVALGSCLSVLLPHGEAHATCGLECTGKMVDADCSEVPQSDGVYDWTQTDGFHAVVSCAETCCGGGGGEDGESTCGTTENARPDSFFFSVQDVTSDDYLSGEVEWEVEEACEGFLVSGSTPLALEHRYAFRVDGRSIATFDVVEEGGCSVGSRSSGGAPVLLFLGFAGWVARRRSRRVA